MKKKKKFRVLVLVHQELVPPDKEIITDEERDESPWVTEFDVITYLKQLKHDVKVLGVYSDLAPIKKTVDEFKPHIVYNLMEEFHGDPLYDQNVVSYLELLKVAYTGCNPTGLILARDKAIAKKILTYHRIKTPNFFVALKNKKFKVPKDMKFPMIVKCLTEEASYGIAKASVVHSEDKLIERLDFLHNNLLVDAIVEEFIEGKEFYVGVMGNDRLRTFPVWELKYDHAQEPEKEIYSSSAKWDTKYRKRKGIHHEKAEVDKEIEKRLITISKKSYRVLHLNGYARMDYRVTNDGQIFLLEANPNPNIAVDDEFARSAQKDGWNYKKLLSEILTLAQSWKRSEY